MRKLTQYLFPLLAGFALIAFLTAPAISEAPSSLDGAYLYAENCARCHGNPGRGDGTEAYLCKRPPADLTTLAERYDGVFPRDHVIATLNDHEVVHTTGMPTMAHSLDLFGEGGQARIEVAFHNLADYIAEIQKK